MWLAENYGVRESYISQIMHNRTHISGNFIGFILAKTQMNFDDLFYYDGMPDCRRFFGKDIHFGGRVLKGDEYYALIEDKLGIPNKVLDI